MLYIRCSQESVNCLTLKSGTVDFLPNGSWRKLQVSNLQGFTSYRRRSTQQLHMTHTWAVNQKNKYTDEIYSKCKDIKKTKKNCHSYDSLHKQSRKDNWGDLLNPCANKRNQVLNIQVITDVMTWHLLWHAFETGTLKDIHHLTSITVPSGKKDSHFDECVSHTEACRQARSSSTDVQE